MQQHSKDKLNNMQKVTGMTWLMAFNANFNNISAIS